MVGEVVWQRRVQQFLSVILILTMVLPMGLVRVQSQGAPAAVAGAENVDDQAVANWQPAPVPLPLPSGLAFNTFDGSLSFGCDEISLPHGSLPLSFGLTWSSDAGWSNRWNIFYWEDLDFVSGDGSSLTFVTGVRFNLAQNGTLAFARNPDGTFEAPPGYSVTRHEGYTATYELKTPDGTRYYFDDAYHQHVTKIQSASGKYLAFFYEPAIYKADLNKISDTFGRSLSFSYDGQGKLAAVTDANGAQPRSLAYGYDLDGQLTSSIDLQGNVTQYSYTGNRLSSITDPAGSVTTIHYVTKIANDKIRGEYDRPRISQVSTPVGDYYFSYQLTGTADQLPLVTDTTTVRMFDGALERTTIYEYMSGLPVKITDPAGGLTRMTWNQDGRLASVTDPNDHTTSYEYDSLGNQVSMTGPLSQTTTYTYQPPLNLLATITDPAGGLTTFTYDSSGNLLSQTDPLSRTVQFEWQGDKVSRVMEPGNRITEFGYNDFDYPVVITDTLGNRRTASFDSAGNLLAMTDAEGNTTQFTYDAAGNLTGRTNALGHGYSATYDRVGNLATLTDPNGLVARYQYDQAGRLTAVVDPQGGQTTFRYDALGNLTRITDPAGHITDYQYDLLGNRTAETDALGNSVSFGYDPAGNLTSRTDAQGRQTTYTYDAADRLTGIDYPGGNDASFGYDAAGRLVSEANDDVQLAYSYDAAGQLLGVHIEPFGKTITYTYDAAGQRAAMKDPDGGLTTYTYDGAGNLATLTGPQGRTATFSWDRDGRLTGQAFESGATITSTLDAAGQIVKQVATSPGAGILLSDAYGYDPAGNRLSVEDKDGALTSYVYDALNQLSEANFPDGSAVQYRYDLAGNRTRQGDGAAEVSYSYDAANRLLAMGDVSYTYDADGNRTGAAAGPQATSYSYNEENLLTQIQPAGGQAVTFSYYPDGRRLSRTDGSGTIYYFYDNDNVLLETDQSGTTTAHYTSWALDRWLTLDQAGQSADYLQDPLGSVLGLLDSSGNLAVAYAYDPFGQPRATSGASANPFMFAGRRYEDGWYYNRYRVYDPRSGRFTTQDPAGIPDGPNRYLYVLNNPTTYIDPYGLACGKPTSFADCHKMCFKFLNPAALQMAGAVAGTLSTGLERKAVDLGNKILAASTTKDWLAAAYKPKEPWWSTGLSALANVAGSILTAGATLAQTSFLGIVGGVLAGWAAGTFVGCTAACLADKEAYDFTANCALKRLLEWQPEEPEGPPDEPGGDHPDENRSAASPFFASGATLVYRQDPYIGLLWRGYAEQAGSLINQVGEMYSPVDMAFDPAIAGTLPVLVIPSGGLYGLENSASFKARLEAYVAAGGTIISFDQQNGDHFGVLPAPASGEPLDGYGWREDNSCFLTSLYISEYHPVLSGISSYTIDAHVDGYFTTLPDGAIELLNRMKNGQPGLVLYRYPSPGQGGYVLSTTIYDDWGGPNRQLTADAVALTRDMLSWAYDPDVTLVDLAPGDTFDLPVEVVNQSAQAAAQIKLMARKPDRKSAQEQIVDLVVPAGGSAATNMAIDVPFDALLGIWWVDYILLDATGAAIQDQAVGSRFIVSDPSPITGPGRDLFLSITAPTDKYGTGTVGEFTFHVFNQSVTPRDVEIRYGLPHHTWERTDPSYGTFDKLIQPMTVAANSEATFVYSPTLYTDDRLWSSLYEGSELRDQAHFAVYNVPVPELNAAVETSQDRYPPGATVAITATLENGGAAPVNAELRLRIDDASHGQLYEESTSRQLASYASTSYQSAYTLPEGAADGVYTLHFETLIGGALARVTTTRFSVVSHLITVAAAEPPIYEPDSTNNVTFTLQNVGFLDISQGTFTVTNTSPSEATIYTDNQSFSLAVGDQAYLVFPVAMTNEFGAYRLEYTAAYHGHMLEGALEIPLRDITQLAPNQTPYRAGQSGQIDVQVTNTGRFRESTSLTVEAPMAAFSQTHSLGQFVPGEVLSDTFTIAVPLETASGHYPLTTTLTLDSGSSESTAFTIFVPPAEFKLSPPPNATAGAPITLTLENVGGATAGAAYTLVLHDYKLLQNMSGELASIQPGASQPFTVTLDPALPSASYSINGQVQAIPGLSTRASTVITVDGVEASLKTETNSPSYPVGSPITASVTITSTGLALSAAPLSLKALASTSEQRWTAHMFGDHGLLLGDIRTVFVDSLGIKWFGYYDTRASALDDGGTPFDLSDDVWQTFTGENASYLNWVNEIAQDDQGRIWFATEYGLRVLDYNGTLNDLSDDRWQEFTLGESADPVKAIAFQGSDLVWIGASDYPDSTKVLRVLDHSGTPFDKSDDQWGYFYSAGDGFLSGSIDSLAIDANGVIWMGTDTGLSALNDGGTPFDKEDDAAHIFTGAPDGYISDIETILVDAQDYKWIGARNGLFVLDNGTEPLNESDDTWNRFTGFGATSESDASFLSFDEGGRLWSTGLMHFSIWAFEDSGTPFDSADDYWWQFPWDDGFGTRVYTIAAEGDHLLWFGHDPDGAGVLDFGGTPGTKGDDQIQYFQITVGAGLYDNSIMSIDIDAGGRAWIGGKKLESSSTGGNFSVLDDNGTRFDRTDDRWQAFTTDDADLPDEISGVVSDPAGPKWIYYKWAPGAILFDDAGTPFDKADDAWQYFDSSDNSSLGFNVKTIVIDDLGLKWFGTDSGMAVLDDRGTPMNKADDLWQTFGSEDGIYSGVSAIQFDDQGLQWIVIGGSLSIYEDNGTPFEKSDDSYTWVKSPFSYYSISQFVIDEANYKWVSSVGRGVKVLDDQGTPLDPSDDAWQFFTVADGLPSFYFDKMIVDDKGLIWFGTSPVTILDYRGTPLDKVDDLWTSLDLGGNLDGYPPLENQTITALVSDGAGGIWFGSDNEGIRLLAEERAVLWQTTSLVDLPSGTVPSPFEVITGVVPINNAGKYYLEAQLDSTIDRPIAGDSYPFYVFDSNIGLTLSADQPLYRPDQAITLTGELLNNSATTLSSQAITITQNGATIFTLGPFDVPPGGSHPYVANTTAPPSPGEIYFKAYAGGVVIEDQVSVALPQVEASISGPDVAGSEPFTVTVMLYNSGRIAAAVDLDFGGDPDQIALQPGQVRYVQHSFQIQADAQITAEISGDLVQSLSHPVKYGLSATVDFLAENAYCAGWASIPYTLTNTGDLELTFTTQVTLTHEQPPATVEQIAATLPVSGTHHGRLVTNLVPGHYDLAWSHPFGAGQASFTSLGFDLATMNVITGAVLAGQATMTVTVDNLGCNPFIGALSVEATQLGQAFFSQEHSLNLALSASEVISFAVGTGDLSPGPFTMTVGLLAADRATLETYTTTGSIPGPDLLLTALPTQTALNAAETVTLTFEVQNQGEVGDQVSLSFGLGDLEDELQGQWIDAGSSGSFDFSFYLPPDLAAAGLLASYSASGALFGEITKGTMIFQVNGISLTVTASSDQQLYLDGDPITFTLQLLNDGAGATGDLSAMVSYGGVTHTQVFSLADGAGTSLDFPLTAAFDGDPLAFYGIYYAGTDRSIVLDTYRLQQRWPAVTVLTDRQRYRPGETIYATVVTTLTHGVLLVQAPGYEAEIPLSDGQTFNFALPQGVARGTYELRYTTLGSGSDEDGRQRSTPFDVDGPLVFVREASLRQLPDGAGDQVILDLMIDSDRLLNANLAGWLEYPDGTLSVGPEQASVTQPAVSNQSLILQPAMNNQATITLTLAEGQSGLYRLHYALAQEGQDQLVDLASGLEAFDLGLATLDRLSTDSEAYPEVDDPVVAELRIYASGPGSGQIELNLDDGPPTSQPVTLTTGFQTITVTLDGPIPAGRRQLTASVIVGGFQAPARTDFDYGASLPDLTPGAPQLSPVGEVTRTLSTMVSNLGASPSAATTAHFYDGDPASGGALIGEAAVPGLDPGQISRVDVEWDIQQAGGDHLLTVVLAPLTEFDTGNNSAQAPIALPRFATDLALAPPAFEAGQVLAVNTQLRNLQAHSPIELSLRVSIYSPDGTLVYSQTRPVNLAAGQSSSLSDSWSTTEAQDPGYYAVLQEVWQESGDYRLRSASAMVSAASNYQLYLPLTIAP